MGGVLKSPVLVSPWFVGGFFVVSVVTGLAVAYLPLAVSLFLFLLVGVALGSLVEPLVGVAAALVLGPWRAWLATQPSQIPSEVGQILFVIAVGAWVLRSLRDRALMLPHLLPFSVPLLVFGISALLSLWNPADVWLGFTEWAKWGQLMLLFVLVCDRICVRGAGPRIIALIASLVGAVLVQAVLGIWQFVLRGYGPVHFMLGSGRYRAYGTFEQPNPFGGFVGMGGALLAGLALGQLFDFFRDRAALRRWLGLVVGALLIILIGLYGSWSRGAWMGFGAALLLMVVGLPKRSTWGLLLALIVIVGGVGVYSAGVLPSSVAERLTGFLDYARFEDVRGAAITDENFAVLERMAHWQAALEMWRANFWTGVGIGCYEAAYPDYRLLNWPYALGHAHNFYLNLLAETGLLGLMAYGVFLVAILWRLWRAVHILEGWRRGLALGLLGAWTHYAVHGLVDNLMVNNVQLHLGVMLALTAWVVSRTAAARGVFRASFSLSEL